MNYKDEKYSYTYSAGENSEVEKIVDKYREKTPSETTAEKIKMLDRTVEKKATVKSVSVGVRRVAARYRNVPHNGLHQPFCFGHHHRNRRHSRDRMCLPGLQKDRAESAQTGCPSDLGTEPSGTALRSVPYLF